MPRIDFSTVEDAQDFSPLPDGKYLCRLAEVEETGTQYGDEMWKLRFVVADGPFKGRRIFDNLVFSEAALKRVKLVCSRLGLDVTGELDLTPELIKDRTCYVTVETDEYEDDEGKTKKKNIVPFAGYERADATAVGSSVSGSDDSEDDLPF